MEKILIKKVYKLIDEESEQMQLPSVCIGIDNKSDPIYTFAFRMLEDVNGRMFLKNSQIKSVEEEIIRYEDDMDSKGAQMAYKGSKNKVCGDKLYSFLEKYLKEANL